MKTDCISHTDCFAWNRGKYRAEDNTITPTEIPIATQWILVDMVAKLETIFGDNSVVCYIGDCLQPIHDREKGSDKD